MELDKIIKYIGSGESDSFISDEQQLVDFYWKYKGLEKEKQRNNEYWSAINKNLEDAYKLLSKKEKELQVTYQAIRKDLDTASRMQKTLLPEIDKKISNIMDIAIYHKQLESVGGDYYDILSDKNNNICIALLDICGHGISAALLTIFLKSQFTQFTNKYSSPQKIINIINRNSFNMMRDLKKYSSINFVTLFNKKIKYVCGGGFGFIIHDNIIPFKKNYNYLGLNAQEFKEYELPLHKNDLIVLYTDGMIASKDKNNNKYSTERFNGLVFKNKDKDVNEILNICKNDYYNFCYKDNDDISVIIMKKK